MQSTAPPTTDVWNDEIKVAWTKAYQSVTDAPAEYVIEDISGTIPAGLRGSLFRNGPGNFERGETRYEHVLDGDGLLCKFSLDGAKGTASFSSRFVRTPEFVQEEEADAVLHRNTFGTQPEGGMINNAFNLILKNPANTNVQSWGGKLLALWEAALPCRINPRTLEFEDVETFGGVLPSGGLTVTTGLGRDFDRSLGLGVAFTAHPREDRKRKRVVGWSWAAPVVGDDLAITLYEWDSRSGEVVHETEASLPSAIAPHDFALTDSWYVFALNAMELRLVPYVLGLTGPVGALLTTGEGVKLRLVPRPGGPAAHRKPFTVETNDPYFAIHHAAAFEANAAAPAAAASGSGSGSGESAASGSSGDGGEEEEEAAESVLTLYTAAWPQVGQGPFLGDWGGDVPLYDDGKISPTLLLKSTIRLPPSSTAASLSGGEGEEVAEEVAVKATVERVAVADGACIDHPHVDPRFEGDHRMRYIYMSWCNPEGESGSPPIGWSRYDTVTGESETWKAPKNTFCEEVVVIPRPTRDGSRSDGEDGVATTPRDVADVWVAAMMFDADKGRSCLCILDGDSLSAGPVCQLWLRSSVPHGLHGCFVPELF